MHLTVCSAVKVNYSHKVVKQVSSIWLYIISTHIEIKSAALAPTWRNIELYQHLTPWGQTAHSFFLETLACKIFYLTHVMTMAITSLHCDVVVRSFSVSRLV